MYIVIIAAFFTAYYFVNVVVIPIKRKLKILPDKRIKPFDCVQCLSVWLAVALYFLPIEYVKFLAIVSSSGFISIKIQ